MIFFSSNIRKRINKLQRILCLVLFLFSKAHAQEKTAIPDSTIISIKADSFNGAFYTAWWRFSKNDSSAMAAKNYNDQYWKVVQTHHIDSSIINGIGWFRVHFTIDTSLVNQPIAFSLKQKGASEIYLDGKLIQQYGTIKDKDSTEYFNPQNTPFIATIGSVGMHVLAIRYARFHFEDTNDDIGFTLDAGNANQVIKNNNVNDVFGTLFLAVLGAFFLTLGFLHFLFFLYYKQNSSNLWFSIFMICIAGIWFSIFGGSHTTDPNISYRISEAIFVIACIASFSFVYFIHILLNNKRKIWLVIPFVLMCGVFICRFMNYADYEIVMVLLIAYSSAYSLVVLLRAIIIKIKGALILGVGFGFFLLSLLGIIVLAITSQGLKLDSSNSLLGQILAIILLLDIVSIPITMSVYQAWIFARLNKDLSSQLLQVKELSEMTIKQEQEKKQLLETQNVELERMVKDRTAQLTLEKQKSDDLLLNILPEEIASELKHNGQSAARQYNHVTVLFTDFVNFTGLSEQMSPTELVAEIHQNFTAFDAIMEKHGLEKIKTIGDAYLAVCGLPNETPDHAQRVVKAAMEIRDYMEANAGKFQIRIGIHTGPVVAGIVGVKKYAYDIWGDTVNTASRMESTSEAGKINISAATYELIKREFDCTYRGKINAKNKGEVDMWFINRSFSVG